MQIDQSTVRPMPRRELHKHIWARVLELAELWVFYKGKENYSQCYNLKSLTDINLEIYETITGKKPCRTSHKVLRYLY